MRFQIVYVINILNFHSAVRRGESDPAFGAEFKFTAHAKELVVGTVYLRSSIHPDTFMPTSKFCLIEGFTMAILLSHWKIPSDSRWTCSTSSKPILSIYR